MSSDNSVSQGVLPLPGACGHAREGKGRAALCSNSLR
jgi:hypothetical protein